jgi:hypothetical protein
MKVPSIITVLTATVFVEAAPRVERQAGPPAVSALNALLPQFGITAGQDRDRLQGGSCGGINQAGAAVPIPCNCPPDRDAFLAKLSAALAVGKVRVPNPANNNNTVEFPISFSLTAPANDPQANRVRANAALTVLQNFNGQFGSGCPAVSVPNFQRMQLTGTRA